MREIKFRGKAKYNEKKHNKGEWVFGAYRGDDKKQAFICETDILETEVDFNTVGQYAGLKDKNGKEIYEGDIVKLKFRENSLEIIARVEYSEEYAQYIVTGTKTLLYECEPLTDYFLTEVIGNIADNPELLEAGD